MIQTTVFVVTLVLTFFYAMVYKYEAPAPADPNQFAIVKKEAPKAEAPAAEVKPKAEVIVSKVVPNPVDIEKGRKIFQTTCIQCHNKDPNIKGPIGPELMDAPLELMTIKVATGRYPEVLPAGFVPKRKTKVMKKFPELEADVPSIHAWIQSVKK